jgi:hypothetical protein
VWEGVLFYLSAMALSAPSRFDLEDTELPLPPASAPPPTPMTTPVEVTGGCSASRTGDAQLAALVLGALAAIGVCARRRSTRR